MRIQSLLLNVGATYQMDVSIKKNDRFRESWQEVQFIKFLNFIRIFSNVVQITVLLADGEYWDEFYWSIDGISDIYVDLFLRTQF